MREEGKERVGGYIDNDSSDQTQHSVACQIFFCSVMGKLEILLSSINSVSGRLIR